LRPALLLAALSALGGAAWGQDKKQPPAPPPAGAEAEKPEPQKAPPSSGPTDAEDDGGEPEAAAPGRQKAPQIDPRAKVNMDFVNTSLNDLVKYMADITGRNFILTDELKGEVTIISHQPVSVPEAYEAFLSALEMAGYTTVTVGQATKVVPTGSAANNPLRVYEGGNIPATDNYVTQIIQLENIAVADVSSIVQGLAGKGAKILNYAPTNTIIITDSANNIRRVYRIISQLDVAAPKAKMEIIPIVNATASDIQKLIEQIYNLNASDSSARSSATGEDAAARRTRRSKRNADAAATDGGGEASSSNVGSEGKYIDRIIADERTNSLIVMANDEAMAAVKELIGQLDVDVDPSSRAQIHVVYLEHSKAEDVSTVLSNLANESKSSSSSSSAASSRTRRGTTGAAAAAGGRAGRTAAAAAEGGAEGGEGGGAVAAFESGLRITSDENTNSLVIIATPDQFEILKQVIDKLDIRRKQVFVECVILEVASDDSSSLGIGIHRGIDGKGEGWGLVSGQFNGDSLTFASSLASDPSGLAIGMFGSSFDVDIPDPTGSGGTVTIPVPAFGVALNAIMQNSSVNILSTPNVLTMDNEEAKIVVGRNVPFPMSTAASTTNLSNSITQYQREDVAITLKVKPQINESNYVTLEVFQEVQEIESSTADNAGGPTTSKRQVESTVVVKDNQTIVIGGLISETDGTAETKVPILGDIPLIGRLFRGTQKTSRKTNMLIFLTPHIIDEPIDLQEIYQIKWAQRQEFLRRFYGKSKAAQDLELQNLLSYSMNQIDKPSRFRGTSDDGAKFQMVGEQSGDADPPPPATRAEGKGAPEDPPEDAP
jgi:general secretion pathway protein D